MTFLVSTIATTNEMQSISKLGDQPDETCTRMEELCNDAFGRLSDHADSLMDDLMRNVDCHEGCPEFEGHKGFEERRYKSLFDDARQPLHPSCPKEPTKLLATIELYSMKAQNGWLDNIFNDLVQLNKKLLFVGNTLLESVYQAKRMISSLGMTYESIHACPNDCILYRKEYKDGKNCPICHISRWSSDYLKKKSVKVPLKVLIYFPLTPRLQRLYR